MNKESESFLTWKVWLGVAVIVLVVLLGGLYWYSHIPGNRWFLVPDLTDYVTGGIHDVRDASGVQVMDTRIDLFFQKNKRRFTHDDRNYTVTFTLRTDDAFDKMPYQIQQVSGIYNHTDWMVLNSDSTAKHLVIVSKTTKPIPIFKLSSDFICQLHILPPLPINTTLHSLKITHAKS